MAAAVEQLVDVATEVANAIGTATLSVPLTKVDVTEPGQWDADDTVTRTYFPQYDLSDLDKIRCTVVPAGLDSTPISRTAKMETYAIDVVLQQKASTDDLRDLVMTVSGEITETLENETLTTSGAVCVSIDDATPFDLDMLQENNVLATATRYRYRLPRSVL